MQHCDAQLNKAAVVLNPPRISQPHLTSPRPVTTATSLPTPPPPTQFAITDALNENAVLSPLHVELHNESYWYENRRLMGGEKHMQIETIPVRQALTQAQAHSPPPFPRHHHT